MSYLLIALFGAAGAVSRYAVDSWASSGNSTFPWGTLIVNVAGAFALGLLIALLTERVLAGENWRLALGVGFLGSFTTFSTYAYETVNLAEDGALGLALVNTLALVGLGLLAAYGGLAIGRALS